MASGRTDPQGGLLGCVFMLLFAVFWTSTAVSTGIPFPMNMMFILVGVLLIVVAVKGIVQSLRPERKPAESGIVDPAAPPMPEEPDVRHEYSGYCPYCGSPVETDHDFCSVCGKRLR